MNTYIITGATRGLGLATAKQLSQQPNSKVVLAVRDTQKATALTQHWGNNIEIQSLDLANLNSVDAFIKNWHTPIAGLMNNAGVQIVGNTRFTQQEGYEETITVNHLAALKLSEGLAPYLNQGRVLFIGSGSHHPNNFTAGLFGFRGAQFESIQNSIEGKPTSTSQRQAGMDRYATSKFLNMVTAVEMARRNSNLSIYCLDPGLMAGTGLVRTDAPIMIFGWKYLLPLIAWALPESSTTTRSANAAVWLLTQPVNHPSGTFFSFNKKPLKQVWEKVYDTELGQTILNDSLALLRNANVSPQPC